MGGNFEIQQHDHTGIALVQRLWEALFDHHLAIGAAGLATIARSESWPRRELHYSGLFAAHSSSTIWTASRGGEVIAYAMAYETKLGGERAMILETLCVLPGARGAGVGTSLMETVDHAARDAGIGVGVVDVMGGNARARGLYLGYGFAPYSETWMTSTHPAVTPSVHDLRTMASLDEFAAEASRLGLVLGTYQGPDDTWESADLIITLSRMGATDQGESRGEAHRPDFVAEVDRLLSALLSAGLWTIQVEIPVGPGGAELRALLHERGYQLCTERLSRML